MNPRCSESTAPPAPCSHLCGSRAGAVTTGTACFQGQHPDARSTLVKSQTHGSGSPPPRQHPTLTRAVSTVPSRRSQTRHRAIAAPAIWLQLAKGGHRACPRAPRGTSSGGPLTHRLHTVPVSSAAWCSSPSSLKTIK